MSPIRARVARAFTQLAHWAHGEHHAPAPKPAVPVSYGPQSLSRYLTEEYRGKRDLISYNPTTVVADFKDKMRGVGLWSEIPGHESEVQKACKSIEQEWAGEKRRDGEPAINHFYYCMSFGFERLTDREGYPGEVRIHPDLGRNEAERVRNFQTAHIGYGLHDGPEDKPEVYTDQFFTQTFDPARVDVPAIMQTTDDMNRYSKKNPQMPSEDEYEAKMLSAAWTFPAIKCGDRTNNLQKWSGLNYGKVISQHAEQLGLPVDEMSPGQVLHAKKEKLGDYVLAGLNIADITELRAVKEARAGREFTADVLMRSADLVRVAAGQAWEEAGLSWGFDPHDLPRRMQHRTPTPPNGGIDIVRVPLQHTTPLNKTAMASMMHRSGR